jgi:hypothetical protein
MSSNVPSEEKVKIGGWLIVIGVLLWLSVISALLNIVFGFQTSHELLITGIINIVFMLPMLVMFHKRKAAIVWWNVIYGVYAVIYECYIQYRQVIAHSSTTIAGHIIAVIIEALLMSIMVMYFFKSKRVKRTFVR